MTSNCTHIPVPEKGVLCPEDLAGEEVKHKYNIQCVKEDAHEVESNGWKLNREVIPARR